MRLKISKRNLTRVYQKKYEENSHLRSLNRRLLEQINKLEEEKQENQDMKNEVNKLKIEEELSCLKVYNISLLNQINKLKNENKLLHNKLEKSINNESLLEK